MTAEIQAWLREVVAPLRTDFGEVFEVGALNVNGSAQDVLGPPRCRRWIGCDRVAGIGVQEVGDAAALVPGRTFDMVVACECYEHDQFFWKTNAAVRSAIRPGGIYVVTTPTIGFPFHDFGGDFYRFTEMALRDVFFEGLAVVDIRTVGTAPFCCACGVAVMPHRVHSQM